MFSKHTRGHKGFRSRIELSRRALNTPTSDSAQNDPRARIPIHPLRGRGRWEEGCGVYKADCSSCIPSRLLGILSPYPLHAHSRSFSLFVSPSVSLPLASRDLPSPFLRFSRRSYAVYRSEQYSSHLNILRAVSRVAIRMLRRCCRKS